MSGTKSFILMALASGVLAVPGLRHGHIHQRSYAVYGSSAAGSQTIPPYPYPSVNSTGIAGPTGTGLSTSQSSSSSSSLTASFVAAMSSAPSPSSVSVYSDTASSSSAVFSPSVPVPATTSSPPYVNGGMGEGADDDSCIPVDSTVTVTTEVYVTVNAGESTESLVASSSAPKPVVSSSVSKPAVSSSASKPIATSSNVAAAAAPSIAVPSESHVASATAISQPAAAPQSISTYMTKAASHSVTVSPVSVIPVSSSSSAPQSSTPAASVSTGKRGLAYNDVELTQCFAGNKHVSWAYNWGSSGSEQKLPEGIRYIPTLWGTASQFTSVWASAAKAAIANGATHLMSFNEPDQPEQANLSPEAAAAAYKQYMQPFAGQNIQLGAPSVTNGGGSMGLTWLSNFLNACDGCQIDFINIHWYDSASNIDYFKSHIQDAIKAANGRPIYVSEFGCTDGSDSDITKFLEAVMPYMDSLDAIEGYAYFMVSDGKLVTGTETSGYGSTYATFTS